MRRLAYVALAVTGCVHAGTHFYPATPEEAVQGQPEAATGEVAGVRLTVHAGDWRGAPEDVEDRATPVEVYVENDSGRPIAIGPEHFGLLAQNGFHYQALDSAEVQRLFGQSYRGVPVYYGFYGAYPWPGFWRPYRHRFYPYMGFGWYSGWGWYGPPVYWAPAPEPPPAPPPQPRGTLQNGGNVSLLLFFPVPASSLGSLEVTMNVVDAQGAQLGTIRVPMVRQAPGQQQGSRPATPPTPPPSQSPPAPPAQGQK